MIGCSIHKVKLMGSKPGKLNDWLHSLKITGFSQQKLTNTFLADSGSSPAGPAGAASYAGHSMVAGFPALDSLEWQDEAARVEDGWIKVKGKHSKRSSPSFDMIHRSHKKGSIGKS
ncbi:uncharacterized protein LOC131063024 [Cryptomeria japonica]|uniref:uncharacterized protein LOC131063024 n=1 Tax=Cryptomeria japonica TaxID=3369 RepID=UPI0025AC804F|nr:uncharacterized protein LOC131063024 [Cryptomeria japonica]